MSGVCNWLRSTANCPPLLSILLANIKSLENKLDDIGAGITVLRDMWDCNILCFNKTWLTLVEPDQEVTPAESFTIFRMDRMEESDKSKGGGVYD